MSASCLLSMRFGRPRFWKRIRGRLNHGLIPEQGVNQKPPAPVPRVTSLSRASPERVSGTELVPSLSGVLWESRSIQSLPMSRLP
jgi:hypothetical protein